MVPTLGLMEPQTPPATELVKAVVLPTHTDDAPDTTPAEGNAITVMFFVAVRVPQVLVTE
jgi:hypothetical protein